jgi:hypothetical protein
MNKNYCEECGEVTGDCVCHLISYVEYQEPDFKFEYAHERVSMGNLTQFMEILPVYE